jgi:putative endonuclease
VARGQPAHLRQGREAEHRACEHLLKHGLELLARNYRTPFGEVDLIMEQQGVLVFVEVRYRRSDAFGTPAETVGSRKQAKLRASAAYYLQQHRQAARQPCRFDVVAVSGAGAGDRMVWLRDAF